MFGTPESHSLLKRLNGQTLAEQSEKFTDYLEGVAETVEDCLTREAGVNLRFEGDDYVDSIPLVPADLAHGLLEFVAEGEPITTKELAMTRSALTFTYYYYNIHVLRLGLKKVLSLDTAEILTNDDHKKLCGDLVEFCAVRWGKTDCPQEKALLNEVAQEVYKKVASQPLTYATASAFASTTA